jgi:hypothetical protein
LSVFIAPFDTLKGLNSDRKYVLLFEMEIYIFQKLKPTATPRPEIADVGLGISGPSR